MKERQNKKLTLPILSIIIVGLIFALGFVLGRMGFDAAWRNGEFTYDIKGSLYPQEKEINFDLFWQVWDTLQQNYVDPNLNEENLFYGAIKGMVSSLNDPATRFFTAEETDEYEQDKAGKLEGIGVELGYLDNSVYVKRTIENAPAERMGVRAGDIFSVIDGEDVSGLSIGEVADRLLGEKGTIVNIAIKRNGDTKDFTIARDEIYVKSVTWEKRDDGIAVINLRRFTEESFSDFANIWDTTIKEVKESNPRGIIIDLRGNGGGYLDGSVYVGGEFVKKGKVILYVQGRDGKQYDKKVERDGQFLDIPLIILVDAGTASSSEIFAGAMQYYNRATIIGEKSYGKGTAQEVIKPVSWGGASIHVTVQKWLLPDKRWITQDNPIMPDIAVEITVDQIKKGEDPQFDRAIEEMHNQ